MNREEIVLREQRDALLREAQQITANPNATKADLKRADVLLAQASNLRSRESMQARAAVALEEVSGQRIEIETEEERSDRLSREDFRSYMRTGLPERRTYSGMSIATDSAGGYFVPQSLYTSVTTALKVMDGLWNSDVITLYEDTHGNALRCPLVDDTGVAAVQIGENQSSDEAELGNITALTLGKIPTWRSKKLIATLELVSDSAFPFESAIVSPAIAMRFQRGISSANASTLISSTTSGATCASAGIVDLDDCLSLMESVDPAYLASEKCFWGMNFTTMIQLLKLKDADGRYLWNPRSDANGRLLLYEKPVVLMPSLPSASTSGAQGVVVLGDFSRCIRRIVKNSMTILRYENAPGLIENALIAYEGFLRTSFGVLSDASSDSPIKYLTAAA